MSALALVILTLTLDLDLPSAGAMTAVEMTVLIIYPVCLLTAGCVGSVLAPTLQLRFDHRWLLFLVATVPNGALWMQWNAGFARHRYAADMGRIYPPGAAPI